MYIVVTLPIITMFLWRLLHTIDKGDEVQNITMAYRLALGQKPWVDIWEIFQSGNSFASPVIWLLVKMTGSTEGIIFFVRGAFLLMNLFLGAVLFFVLKNYISKSILGACILAIICYAPFSLYYIWYDSMGLYFMLLGEILLFAGLQSGKGLSWPVFFAGVSHALMSYAYPSFVLLAFIFAGILYWLNKKKKRKNKIAFGQVCIYFAGAALIFCIFLIYLLSVGIDNTIFVKKDIIELLLSSHGAQKASLVKRIFRLFWWPLKKMEWSIIPTIFLGAFYYKSIKKCYAESTIQECDRRKIIGFLLAIVVIPLILFSKLKTLSTIYYTFYIFCWAPFLLKMVTNIKVKTVLLELFYIMWIPCGGSYILIGFTSNNGGYKSPLGMYSGFIFCIIVMGILFQNILMDKYDKSNSYLVFSCLNVVTVSMVVLFILNTFWYGNVQESTYKFKSGIFKGLYGQVEDKKLEKQEMQLKDIVNSENQYLSQGNGEKHNLGILCVGSDLLSVYLYTDLRPATFFFAWDPYLLVNERQDWSPTKKYWQTISGYPDFLLISDAEEIDEDFWLFLKDLYKYCTNIEDASVWIKK